MTLGVKGAVGIIFDIGSGALPELFFLCSQGLTLGSSVKKFLLVKQFSQNEKPTLKKCQILKKVLTLGFRSSPGKNITFVTPSGCNNFNLSFSFS